MKISKTLRNSNACDRARFNGRAIAADRGGVIGPDGTLHPLRRQSQMVLEHLAADAGGVVSRQEIFEAVWPGIAVTDDSLTQCIRDIRGVLADDERRVLETIPRQGFCLHPDTPAPRQLPGGAVLAVAIGLVLVVAGTGAALWRDPPQQEYFATLSLAQEEGTEPLAAELATALDRYPSVHKVTRDARFELRLSRPSPRGLLIELLDTATSTIVFSDTIQVAGDPEALASKARILANRVAASSGSGVIAQVLFAELRDKPLRELTNGECYLLYHAINRGGSSMPKNHRARTKACLEAIVAREPDNPRARSRLGATLIMQYWYGTGLDDPRDIPDVRQPLAREALRHAEAAEAAGMPPDAEVHRSVAMVYFGNCMKDHAIASLRRAMNFRPDSPELLGTAGNWISYLGDWETGVPMARRAIELSQENAARWWYWPIGKDAWRKGDYETALKFLMRGHEPASWVSQLHLAYTLPLLGRQAEAEAAVARLRELWPGFTRADARRTHRRWCFDEDFIAKMDDALAVAGLPEAPEIGAAPTSADTAGRAVE